jgi:hypothetical protein
MKLAKPHAENPQALSRVSKILIMAAFALLSVLAIGGLVFVATQVLGNRGG